MKFPAQKYSTELHRSLQIDDSLVHQVVRDVAASGTDKSYVYRVLCGKYQGGMLHLYYCDKQVTCLVCLGTDYAMRKCCRSACETYMPPTLMYVHKNTRALYCHECARLINRVNNEELLTAQEGS